VELQGKVAVVTGASRGIGRAIAVELGRAGARVVVNYRSGRQAAEEVAAAIPGSVAVQADVSTAEGCEALIAAALELGGVHVLVNNAGITDDRLALKTSDEHWRRVLSVNADAPFRLSRLAMTWMFRNGGGAIVNVISVAALKGNRGQASYAASKGAVLAMTRVLAQEMGRRGIRVNAVAPGFVETGMTADLHEKVREGALAQIPLRRFGQPEEIASVVRFLCGPGASYVNGQCLVVDGGMTA